jgi:hypothetical protein
MPGGKPSKRVLNIEKGHPYPIYHTIVSQLEKMSMTPGNEDSFYVKTHVDVAAISANAKKKGMRMISKIEGRGFRMWRVE